MWIYLIIVGLCAGALAKALMPGSRNEPSGCMMTMLLGIGGSLVTGFLLHDVLKVSTSGSFTGTVIGATLGAMLILAFTRKLWK